MSQFYDNLAQTASGLLHQFGQSVTFHRGVVGQYDPSTGKPAVSTLSYTGFGAAFDYSRKEIDGTNVLSGDIKFLLERTTTTPAVHDVVTIDGKGYRVLVVTPTAPGGTVVMYECQLRFGGHDDELR